MQPATHVQHLRLAVQPAIVIRGSRLMQPKCQFSVTRCDTTCDSQVQPAMVFRGSQMRHPKTFNSLSPGATSPATRRWYMRLADVAYGVAFGPTLGLKFFFICFSQKSENFDNFWIKWSFGESSSLWRFEGVQEHKNKSKIQLPSNQLQIDSNFGFKFSSM